MYIVLKKLFNTVSGKKTWHHKLFHKWNHGEKTFPQVKPFVWENDADYQKRARLYISDTDIELLRKKNFNKISAEEGQI